MKNIFETIKEIAEAKAEAKKAINQIDTYETEQKIKKLTDKLVAQYIEQCAKESEEELYDIATKNTIAELGYEYDANDHTDHSGANAHWASYRLGWIAGYKKAKEEI